MIQEDTTSLIDSISESITKATKRFTRFIPIYNRIGYGEAKVIETRQNIVIELWNAGHSDNEYLEFKFCQNESVKRFMALNYHPITVFVLPKIWMLKSDIAKFKRLDCYEKQEEFKMITTVM